MSYRVLQGDCVELMAAMPAGSVDAVVCDPPYGLEFMGKEWDSFKSGRAAAYAAGGELITAEQIEERRGKGGAGPSYVNRPAKRCKKCGKQAWSGSPCQCERPEWELDNSPLHAAQEWHQAWATEALRVLKPGGHLLAFGGTRTYHRLVCAVEDAGFEIRDTISWLYGSGFPKSLNVGNGFGTALKPAHEPVVVARKPLSGTVAGNVLEHGTGALNVDATRIGASTTPACRGADSNGGSSPSHESSLSLHTLRTALVGAADELPDLHSRLVASDLAHALGARPVPDFPGDCLTCSRCGDALARLAQEVAREAAPSPLDAHSVLSRRWLAERIRELRCDGHPSSWDALGRIADSPDTGYSTDQTGRWPANVVLDGEAARLLDEQTGERAAGRFPANTGGFATASGIYGHANGRDQDERNLDAGGASRFFYVAKASRAERNAGLEGFEEQLRRTMDGGALVSEGRSEERGNSAGRNVHPTVKPISLMRWLVRLVTPPNGTVLDPFAGSGTTGCAAVLEGFDFVGLEREPEYVKIAEARIAWWHKHRGDGEAADILAAGEFRDSVAATGQLGMFD